MAIPTLKDKMYRSPQQQGTPLPPLMQALGMAGTVMPKAPQPSGMNPLIKNDASPDVVKTAMTQPNPAMSQSKFGYERLSPGLYRGPNGNIVRQDVMERQQKQAMLKNKKKADERATTQPNGQAQNLAPDVGDSLQSQPQDFKTFLGQLTPEQMAQLRELIGQ